MLLQLSGKVNTRVALLDLAVVRAGEQGHLACRRVGWNLESTGVWGSAHGWAPGMVLHSLGGMVMPR
jgi:hypothetical protein